MNRTISIGCLSDVTISKQKKFRIKITRKKKLKTEKKTFSKYFCASKWLECNWNKMDRGSSALKSTPFSIDDILSIKYYNFPLMFERPLDMRRCADGDDSGEWFNWNAWNYWYFLYVGIHGNNFKNERYSIGRRREKQTSFLHAKYCDTCQLLLCN